MTFLNFFILTILISCSNKMESNENTPIDDFPNEDEVVNIWEGLSKSAPEKTKEWGFALGLWKVTITNHLRNGYKNNGTGSVTGYIDKDSLTIIRRFSVFFNDNSRLSAIDTHKYSELNQHWEMYLLHDNWEPTQLGTSGNFNDEGDYIEISPGGYDTFFESNRTWKTKMYDISENEYKVLSILIYDDGKIIEDAYTAHFIRK